MGTMLPPVYATNPAGGICLCVSADVAASSSCLGDRLRMLFPLHRTVVENSDDLLNHANQVFVEFQAVLKRLHLRFEFLVLLLQREVQVPEREPVLARDVQPLG